MIHALTLLSILVVAAPLAQYIPLAVLAAILMVVSYNMGEWREIPKLLKMTWADISVWVTTFSLTVFADLTVAVEIGMSLAALLYIRKVTHTTTVSRVTQEYVEEGRLHVLQDKQIPDYVTLFRIHGPFLFGSTEKLQEAVGRLEDLAPIVIVRLRNMTAIDATGVLTLEELAHKIQSTGRTLLVCGAGPAGRIAPPVSFRSANRPRELLCQYRGRLGAGPSDHFRTPAHSALGLNRRGRRSIPLRWEKGRVPSPSRCAD